MSWDSEEWRSAVHALTENDRAATALAVRQADGLCGDLDDVRYGGADYR